MMRPQACQRGHPRPYHGFAAYRQPVVPRVPENPCKAGLAARRGRGAALAGAGVVLAAYLAAVAPQATATPANPDCDNESHKFLPADQPRLRFATFDYLTGVTPIWTPTKVMEASIHLAANAWTLEVNDCGWVDHSAVVYEFGQTRAGEVGTPATHHGNGKSEIFWGCFGACDYVAYQTSRPAECDIVMNPDFGDFLLPDAGTLMYALPQYLPTILAHEMGHCIGLDHPQNMESMSNRVHTMSRGYCVNDPASMTVLDRWVPAPFGYVYLAQLQAACGLTLSKGDMIGVETLFSSEFPDPPNCLPDPLPYVGGSCPF